MKTKITIYNENCNILYDCYHILYYGKIYIADGAIMCLQKNGEISKIAYELDLFPILNELFNGTN